MQGSVGRRLGAVPIRPHRRRDWHDPFCSNDPPGSSAAFSESTRTHPRGLTDPKDMKDIKDISEKELTKLYSEYQAGLGRPVPTVVHRQDRGIPGCVSTEDSAAWKSR